jgi:hypothetical protein
MASIHKEMAIEVSPEQAWAALRRVGDAHRLFAPVLTNAQLDDDVRTVRFANGMVLQERILDIDDERRRVAYTALNGPGMTYHHASMQVVAAGPGRCVFVWITDFLPRQMSDTLTPLIEQGTKALKSNLERVDPERKTE